MILQVIRKLAGEAASILHKGTASVAVNCLSGRGRTGTFSAIILGKLLSIKSQRELIDAIVSMREHRDGLVETPAQFRFAAIALNLPDTRNCNIACIAKTRLESFTPSIYVPFLSGVLFTVIILLGYVLGIKNNFFDLFYSNSYSVAQNNKYRHIRPISYRDKGEDIDEDSEEKTKTSKKSLL